MGDNDKSARFPVPQRSQLPKSSVSRSSTQLQIIKETILLAPPEMKYFCRLSGGRLYCCCFGAKCSGSRFLPDGQPLRSTDFSPRIVLRCLARGVNRHRSSGKSSFLPRASMRYSRKLRQRCGKSFSSPTVAENLRKIFSPLTLILFTIIVFGFLKMSFPPQVGKQVVVHDSGKLIVCFRTLYQ